MQIRLNAIKGEKAHARTSLKNLQQQLDFILPDYERFQEKVDEYLKVNRILKQQMIFSNMKLEDLVTKAFDRDMMIENLKYKLKRNKMRHETHINSLKFQLYAKPEIETSLNREIQGSKKALYCCLVGSSHRTLNTEGNGLKNVVQNQNRNSNQLTSSNQDLFNREERSPGGEELKCPLRNDTNNFVFDNIFNLEKIEF